MSFLKGIKIFFIACLVISNVAYAENSLKIDNTWSPAAPPVAKVMAGYMTISNNSQHAIKVSTAKSPLFKNVEIHLTKMENDMMRMVKQEHLNIPANTKVELKPGGLHMMLIGKLKPIKTGSSIPVTISFDNGESINITLAVKENNEPQMMHDHSHHH